MTTVAIDINGVSYTAADLVHAFINFVHSRAPDVLIDHNEGWDSCAVGEFIREIVGPDQRFVERERNFFLYGFDTSADDYPKQGEPGYVWVSERLPADGSLRYQYPDLFNMLCISMDSPFSSYRQLQEYITENVGA